MPDIVYKRCMYVINENNRVMKAGKLLKENKLEEFGALLFATHLGLMNEYEVSCKELDFLFEFARNFDGVIGARMMGGGFGGCTLNLVEESRVKDFSKQITEAYHNTMNINLDVYEVEISNGTELISA
jgi:galactokinase